MSDHADHFTAMTDAWTTWTGSVLKSAMAANTAALTAFEPTDDPDPDGSDRRPGVDSVLYEDDDWVSKRSVDAREEITVGDVVEFTKTLSDDDIRQFAEAGGDTNRLHRDDGVAEKTRFGGRIVHGTLVSALVSAALARLPGLTIYVSQDLEFRRPVGIGDRITAVVKVVEDLGDGRYRLSTVVEDADGENVVIDGEAVVFIESLPE